MKRKIVLSLVSLVLLLSFVTASVYAYYASTVCLRWSDLGFNWAYAVIGNRSLSNGTYNVYAEVDQPAAESGSFGNQRIMADEGDVGPHSNSGTANAFVGGYDSDGIYQSDTDSDSN